MSHAPASGKLCPAGRERGRAGCARGGQGGRVRMKIVKLEPSQHRQGRWLAWLEEGKLVRLEEADVVSLGLYAGKELTAEEGAALWAAARQGKADRRALELLAARPMSRKELVDKLSASAWRRRGPDREEAQDSPEEMAARREQLRADAQRAADRMERLGLLDDGQYAESVVRHYAARGYGARKIADELYRRGVPRQLWEEALAQLEDQGEEALDRLVQRRMRGGQPTRESLKKTSDYLARRGFGWEEIAGALERYRRDWEECGESSRSS